MNILGNEAVNLAKVTNNLIDAPLHVVVVADVELVSLDLDPVFLGQGLDILLGALLSRRVGDGNVGAHFSTPASRFNAHAAGARGARHDDNLALEAKEVNETIGLGDGDGHGDDGEE